MPVYPYLKATPVIGEGVFLAPDVSVIGDVEIGDSSSVWFGSVIRGDVFHIRIGDRTNIQDLSVVHVTTDRHATILGNDITVGHRAILHGCTVEDGCLIGMGAIIMDRAVIGAGALVAAGSIVTEGTRIPPGTLAMGTPARPKRDLTDKERAHQAWAATHYVDVAADYVKRLGRGY